MLFRRIKTHIEKENWFAVGIDFAIVVVGVFIGLQVANWNDARTDAVREKEIFAHLLDDLQADKAALSVSSSLATLGIDAGNIALLEAGQKPVEIVSFPLDSNAFTSNVVNITLPSPSADVHRDDLWKHAIIRLYPSQNSATIESLIVADNSSVIENASLVRDLLQYRTSWTNLETAQATTFRPIRDRLMFAGQDYDLSPFTPSEPHILTDAISESPTLRASLRTMLEYTAAQRSLMEQIQKQADSLAARVEAELSQ